MNEIIPVDAVINSGENGPTTTSLMVAEVFGKNHRHVLRDIANLEVPAEWGRSNFGQSSYVNSQNKMQPMVEMTRDGFDILVMGFTGSEAMKYKLAFLEAFNRMKQELAKPALPSNYRDALAALLESEDRRIADAKERALEAPKVAFCDCITVSEDTILVREMAKLITHGTPTKIGGNDFYKWLRANGYVIRQNGSDYNLPTQKSIDLGIMIIKEGARNNGADSHITKTTKITGKGQVYFMGKFNKESK